MHTANAANAGAERGHSRAPVPRPQHRGQAALEEPPVGRAPLCDFLRDHSVLPPGPQWHGRRLLRAVA